MWTTNGNIPERTGTIEDIIVWAGHNFSDLQMQAKYIKISVDLIQRDGGDDVKVSNFVYSNYEGVLTIFPSAGEVFAHWELYENGGLEASGLEKYTPATNKFQLLFSSSLKFNHPILPNILYNQQ